MARKVSPREIGLVAALAAIALLALYYGSDGVFSGGSDERDLQLLELGEVPGVAMANLRLEAAAYDEDGRSLFKYYTPPVKAPPRRPVPKPIPRKAPTAPPVERRPPPPPRETKPRPPAIDFQFIGYLGPKDFKLAVFEDDEGVMVAGAGQVVREQFRVVEFGYDNVVMGYVDEKFRDETTELRQKNR